MDVIDEDKLSLTDNKLDIWNTQLLVINRVIDRINRGDLRDGEFELTGNPSIEPFTDRFENALAGWTVTFDLMVKNSMTIC
jgi:alpha-amylase/alpha-mannosidase (GH57 family)